MRARKVNDSEILNLLRQGKNQKQISQALGVSNVAIHKRLKKILPKPKSLENLTPKEQKFCELVAQGKSRTEAALEAYDCSNRESAKALQNALMAKDDIKKSISDLMATFGLTRGYRLYKLRDHVDNPDPVVSLKALDLSWKLDGSYAPEKRLIGTSSISQLVAELFNSKKTGGAG